MLCDGLQYKDLYLYSVFGNPIFKVIFKNLNQSAHFALNLSFAHIYVVFIFSLLRINVSFMFSFCTKSIDFIKNTFLFIEWLFIFPSK